MIPKLFQNIEYTNLINFINIIKLQMEELRLNFVKWFQRANIQTQVVCHWLTMARTSEYIDRTLKLPSTW